MYFDSHVYVSSDGHPDGEGAARKARAAVLGCVGGEFGSAQDHVVGSGAVIEDCTQIGADSADVLGTSGIGDLSGA